MALPVNLGRGRTENRIFIKDNLVLHMECFHLIYFMNLSGRSPWKRFGKGRQHFESDWINFLSIKIKRTNQNF